VPLLKDRREDLGFSLGEVASEAGLSRARYKAIEKSDELEAWEADVLSDLLGVDVIELVEGGDVEPSPLSTLLRNSRQTLAANTRFEIVRTIRVATELAQLRELLDGPTQPGLWSTFEHSSDYRHPAMGVPARLSAEVRTKLGLGDAPIQSVTDEVVKPLGVTLLWADLAERVDAFTFISSTSAPTIVLNIRGEHTTTAHGRRMTLLHEVCHALFDRTVMQQVGRFCDMKRAKKIRAVEAEGSLEEQIERRARAFAGYFIAPPDDLVRSWNGHSGDVAEKVRGMMERYGFGYEAARTQLQNLDLLDLQKTVSGVPLDVPAALETADPGISTEVRERHHRGVPLARAGELFDLVRRGLEQGEIGEGAARDYLRVPLSTWKDIKPLLVPGDQPQMWRVSSSLDANGT
jgi:Zn-dependent peptidase ImmA (M78 family)/transcriptional regulator with XRE-family HTH domain